MHIALYLSYLPGETYTAEVKVWMTGIIYLDNYLKKTGFWWWWWTWWKRWWCQQWTQWWWQKRCFRSGWTPWRVTSYLSSGSKSIPITYHRALLLGILFLMCDIIQMQISKQITSTSRFRFSPVHIISVTLLCVRISRLIVHKINCDLHFWLLWRAPVICWH